MKKCVGIVSLSSGVLGEDFVKHEVRLVEERLQKIFGFSFKYMNNTKKGEKYLAEHPEAKAADLKQAFLDPEVDIIWTVLGGDDTFRTLPYLMNEEFKEIVQKNPKPFLGFSDTTNNHLMLHKMGLKTFYAPSLFADIAELGPEILPYTKEWLDLLFADTKTTITVESSPFWYEARADFSEKQLGVERIKHEEKHGFEFLYGNGIIEGELLGGCLESLSEMLTGGRYDDQLEIYGKYNIFPTPAEWKNKIAFIETSEERPTPEKVRKMLEALEKQGVFEAISALIIGKPQDEIYYHEYKELYQELAEKYSLPTVYNLNFGHSSPRMVLPYGRKMRIDFECQTITLPEGLVG